MRVIFSATAYHSLIADSLRRERISVDAQASEVGANVSNDGARLADGGCRLGGGYRRQFIGIARIGGEIGEPIETSPLTLGSQAVWQPLTQLGEIVRSRRFHPVEQQ